MGLELGMLQGLPVLTFYESINFIVAIKSWKITLNYPKNLFKERNQRIQRPIYLFRGWLQSGTDLASKMKVHKGSWVTTIACFEWLLWESQSGQVFNVIKSQNKNEVLEFLNGLEIQENHKCYIHILGQFNLGHWQALDCIRWKAMA